MRTLTVGVDKKEREREDRKWLSGNWVPWLTNDREIRAVYVRLDGLPVLGRPVHVGWDMLVMMVMVIPRRVRVMNRVG